MEAGLQAVEAEPQTRANLEAAVVAEEVKVETAGRRRV